MQSTEMKFKKYPRGCTEDDKIRNEKRTDMDVFSINDTIHENKTNGKIVLVECRLTKKIMNNQPIRKTDLG